MTEENDYTMLHEESASSNRVSDREGVVELGTMAGIGGYAEMFETIDGANIECGFFVTLDGRKIRKANSRDKFILGITTATPTALGNNDVRWKNKYLTDKWGRIIYEEVSIPALLDEEGNELMHEHIEKKPVINPKWDKNKSYIPRILRPEWVPVALLGQVLVRDDGSCTVNEYCLPNERGIAAAASRGYRVLERRNQNQILILLRPTTVMGSGSRR